MPRILGIDPGLRITGYACLEARDPGAHDPAPGATSDGIHLVEAGCFTFGSGRPVEDRLVELERDLIEVIERGGAEAIAVEKLYSHYKHPTTSVIMGHARGVILLAGARAGLEVIELEATSVKKSLTGHGHASKGQIQAGVARELSLGEVPEPPDVADAIAIALCAIRRHGAAR